MDAAPSSGTYSVVNQSDLLTGSVLVKYYSSLSWKLYQELAVSYAMGKYLRAETFSANYPITQKNQSQPVNTQMFKRDLVYRNKRFGVLQQDLFNKVFWSSPITNARRILVGFLLENKADAA